MVARKRVERGLKTGRDLAPPNDVDRVGAVEATEERKVEVCAVLDVEPGFFEVRRLAARLSDEVDAEVGDDAIKPGEEGRAALEGVKAFEDSKEGVLNELAGVVLVANEGKCDREGSALVAFGIAAGVVLILVLKR